VSGGPKVREVYASYSIGGMLGVKGRVYLYSYLTLFPKKNMLCNIDDIKKNSVPRFCIQGNVRLQFYIECVTYCISFSSSCFGVKGRQ